MPGVEWSFFFPEFLQNFGKKGGKRTLEFLERGKANPRNFQRFFWGIFNPTWVGKKFKIPLKIPSKIPHFSFPNPIFSGARNFFHPNPSIFPSGIHSRDEIFFFLWKSQNLLKNLKNPWNFLRIKIENFYCEFLWDQRKPSVLWELKKLQKKSQKNSKFRNFPAWIPLFGCFSWDFWDPIGTKPSQEFWDLRTFNPQGKLGEFSHFWVFFGKQIPRFYFLFFFILSNNSLEYFSLEFSCVGKRLKIPKSHPGNPNFFLLTPEYFEIFWNFRLNAAVAWNFGIKIPKFGLEKPRDFPIPGQGHFHCFRLDLGSQIPKIGGKKPEKIRKNSQFWRVVVGVELWELPKEFSREFSRNSCGEKSFPKPWKMLRKEQNSKKNSQFSFSFP